MRKKKKLKAFKFKEIRLKLHIKEIDLNGKLFQILNSET